MKNNIMTAQRDKAVKRHGSGRNRQDNGSGWLAWLLAALLLLCVRLLVSCGHYRHLATSGSVRDSVRVETVIRTEIIPDTVYVEVPEETVRQTVRDTASHLETSLAVSDARLNADGMLFHSLENKGGKRPVEVKKEVVYRDSVVYRDRAVTRTETVEVRRPLTRWQRMQIWGFWALAAAAAVAARGKIVPAVLKIFGAVSGMLRK